MGYFTKTANGYGSHEEWLQDWKSQAKKNSPILQDWGILFKVGYKEAATFSLKAFPAENAGTVVAGMVMGAPV